MAGKGTEAMKKRMAYVRSFRKTKKGGKMSPKREVKAASPRRMTRKSRATKKEERKSRKSPTRKVTRKMSPKKKEERKSRKSPTRKSRKSPTRKSPTRRSRKSAMKVKTYA